MKPDPVPTYPPRGQPWLSRRWSCALSAGAALAATAPLSAYLVRILVQRPVVILGFDQALLELATGEAARGLRLVGPYSRFGWQHPGPAWFYLLAVPYRLLGRHTWSFLVAVALFQALCLVAIVVVAHRRGGGLLALMTSISLLLYLRSVGVDRFIFPWNPWALFLPLCLFVLVGASHLGRPTARLLWLAVIGSVLVQTHFGVAPAVLATLAAAGVLSLLRRGDAPPAAGGRRPLVLGAVVLVALWVPPLIDQATGSPGNLSRVAAFAVQPHDGPSFEDATHLASAALGGSPFSSPRYADDVNSASRSPNFLVLDLILAAVLVGLGWWLRDRFLVDTGLLTAVALIASVVAITRITGPVFGFLTAWISALPLPLWIAAASLALRPVACRRRFGQATAVALGLGLVVLAAQTAQPLADGSLAVGSNAPVAEAWNRLRPALAGRDGPVLVRITDAERWPVAAGLVLQMTKVGRRAVVPDEWLFMFGSRYRRHGLEPLEVMLSPTDTPPPGGRFPGATLLGQFDGTDVWLRDGAGP